MERKRCKTHGFVEGARRVKDKPQYGYVCVECGLFRKTLEPKESKK